MNSLGTHSISDPTTAGDYCCRYSIDQIDQLQEEINTVRLHIGSQQPASFFREAVVDLDGALAFTHGECKEGMNISYKGECGYNSLIVSLSNTGEILYVKNRSGNCTSHEEAHVSIDKRLTCYFMRVLKRFVFGVIRILVKLFILMVGMTREFNFCSEWIRCRIWNFLRKHLNLRHGIPLAYEVQTKSRSRRRQVKKSIVLEQCYRNFVLEHENVAEIDYRLMKCNRSYRLVILRKTILAKEGQKLLFPEICYFFYLTNVRTRSLSEVVFDANKKQNKEAGMRMFRYNNIP